MAKIKPVNMDSDTFQGMKGDMTVCMNRLLRLMQKYGQDEGKMTVSVKIRLDEDVAADGPVPRFEHKVTTTVQRKDEAQGRLGGEYVLSGDEQGGFVLRPIAQLEMFEEALPDGT